MIELRKQHAIFGRASTQILDTNNQNLFAYVRHNEEGKTLLVICNFSEFTQVANTRLLDQFGHMHRKDLISGKSCDAANETLEIGPYQFLWLTVE